jgi:hypothetical protein
MPEMQDPHDVNLIPPARLSQKRLRARLRLWAEVCGIYGLLIAVALLCAHVAWGEYDSVVSRQVQLASRRNEEVTASIVEARRRLAHAVPALQAAQTIQEQPDWSRLLALLAGDLGDDIVLKGCKLLALDGSQQDLIARLNAPQDRAAAALVFGPRPYQLQLTGFGKTRHAISEFTVRLERAGLFAAVRCTHSDREPLLNGEATAFTVECQL